jgi:uncharacterized protein
MQEILYWKNVEDAVDQMVKQASNLDINYIYGIPRGGMVLAVMLSHRLNLPIIRDLKHLNNGNVLIVDDIVDTGTTLLAELRKSWKQYGLELFCFSMHWNPDSLVRPTWHANTKTDDNWIVYPWETPESEKDEIPDYLVK